MDKIKIGYYLYKLLKELLTGKKDPPKNQDNVPVS